MLFAFIVAASSISSLQPFRLDAPGRGPRIPPDTRQMALYPLPAVYLPGTRCMVRNIEARNLAMCRERAEFVAAYVSADRATCAAVGSVLRIDDVQAAVSDKSGKVLAEAAEAWQQSRKEVLEVSCTVVGRVRLVACENLEAWRKPERDEYLVADVAAYADAEDAGDDTETEEAVEQQEQQDATAPEKEEEEEEDKWWMGASAAGDAADAIYRLVDALLESQDAEKGRASAESGIDMDATVASLERAAELAEDEDWWAALDLWQMHCATRLAAAAALHRTERNEFIIDAKLRQGGPLQIPVQEWLLEAEDRAKLLDLDARASDAAAQMGLDDATDFQACLETQRPAERAQLLLRGVQRETERLATRAALERAFDVDS